MNFDVVVIGGGPAGMMAAARAGELGARVLLLEKNPTLGKKLLITGGGRCNILHAEFDAHRLIAKYGKRGQALHSTFAQFGAQEAWDFFESRGLKLKIEADQRAFPKSDKAANVLDVLVRALKKNNVTIQTDCTVKRIESDGSLIKKVIHTSGQITAKNFILATGGKSRPETGSTGDGFAWLRELGHKITEPSAALVPVIISNAWAKDLAGISLQGVKLTLWQEHTRHESHTGKMLFTGTGLSGPLVLNMSKRIGELLEEGPVTVALDLFPSLDGGALDRKLVEIFGQSKNKLIKNHIGLITKPRLAHAILLLAGIDPATPLHQLTRSHRLAFGKILKHLPMNITGLLGTDKAVVTGGGIDLKELDFKTMRSKKYTNLYLTGDILDFDRPSGGFSLQICWSTGFVAGSSAAA
ncbi:MAG: flavoprotein [Candidatus Peregrinibacteria bacterium Greene1014_49]|nr:MAG: flavoprotein [Candidatus Peregrinibacteria bacterium Greene1014_49]